MVLHLRRLCNLELSHNLSDKIPLEKIRRNQFIKSCYVLHSFLKRLTIIEKNWNSKVEKIKFLEFL
jgi:hypothetical protein